jgi:hypothetical protein
VRKGHPKFEHSHTEFRDKALYLNGRYELAKEPGGYHALCKTPRLDYKSYTVALRFKAEEFGPGKGNLITGGTATRWFGLERSLDGKLVVTLNNHRFKKELDGPALEAGKWTVVACSVDIPGRKVIASLNGEILAEFELPEGFEPTVAGGRFRDSDKVWTFSDHSNGNTLHGLVDELMIYGRAMSAAELKKIPLRP